MPVAVFNYLFAQRYKRAPKKVVRRKITKKRDVKAKPYVPGTILMSGRTFKAPVACTSLNAYVVSDDASGSLATLITASAMMVIFTRRFWPSCSSGRAPMMMTNCRVTDSRILWVLTRAMRIVWCAP